MLLFLLVYVSIYLLMHGYAFLHAWQSLRFGRRAMLVLAAWTLLMTFAPIIVRLAERKGYELFPKILAYISFTWMGLLFLFLFIAIVVDACRSVSTLLRRNGACRDGRVNNSSGSRFIAEFIVVLVIYGYGMVEAGTIRVEHQVVVTPKIGPGQEAVRLVQISDVHLGLIVRKSRLRKILDRVREADADLLVSTGDLVDGQLDNLAELEQMLAAIEPPLGKVAVTGNHEFYAGLDEALGFTARAGFSILRNEALEVGGLQMVGVDDMTVEQGGRRQGRPEQELLNGLDRELFTVLLKHRPVVEPASLGLFDLQLSGHTHKGQIFPFNMFTWLSFRYPNGMNRLADGVLYISRGSGTWGPPIRVLAPPEVTVIDIVGEASGS